MLWQQLDIALKGAGGSASTCQEGVGERKVCQAILQSQPLLALSPTAAAAAAAATWRFVRSSAAGQLLQLAPSTAPRAALPLPQHRLLAFSFIYSFFSFFFFPPTPLPENPVTATEGFRQERASTPQWDDVRSQPVGCEVEYRWEWSARSTFAASAGESGLSGCLPFNQLFRLITALLTFALQCLMASRAERASTGFLGPAKKTYTLHFPISLHRTGESHVKQPCKDISF